MNNRNELFVVLATATILTVMVFSLLNSAGCSAAEKSRRAQCVSNLSQIGKAFFQYAMSNDDWYPTSSKTSTPKWMNGDSGRSFDLLYKADLLTDPKGYLCPSKDGITVAKDGQSLLGHVSYNWSDGHQGGDSMTSPMACDGLDNHTSSGFFVRGDGSVGSASGTSSEKWSTTVTGLPSYSF